MGERTTWTGIGFERSHVLKAVREQPSDLLKMLAFILLCGFVGATILWTTDLEPAWNYWFAAGIGLAVGATELMARYRDAPFASIASLPGFTYMAVNAGAAALAYYLIDGIDSLDLSPAMHVLTAGVGAMAFFRSGLFTARFGDEDVAVGPNMILQIMLQALDRAYDRDRAQPRSIETVDIMAGISFAQSKKALPSICFNLMQNVATEEQEALAKEVEALERQSDIADEGRSLILGLALMNIVGVKTLRAAVDAMGTSLQESKRIDPSLLDELAKVEPATAIAALPSICNSVCHKSRRVDDPQRLLDEVLKLNLGDESTAVLMLHRLVQHYGQSAVSVALGTMPPG